MRDASTSEWYAGCMRLRFGGLWRQPDFLSFWAAQSISRLGTFITALALPTAAIELLGAGPIEISVLAALQSLPFPVLGIASGVIADRLPRRPIMIVCDLGRLIALGSVPVADLADHLTLQQLYVVALVVGVFTPFSVVASQAYLKGLVARNQLMEGNAKLEVSNSTAGVAGRAVAGLLIHWLQAPMAILVDAATYLVSTVLLLTVRKAESVQQTRQTPARGDFWRDVWQGLVATVGDRTIRLIAVSSATVNLGQNIAQSVYLLYAYEALDLNAAQVGFILMVGSAGSVLGALAVYPVSGRIGAGPAMATGVLVAFASYLLLPLAQVGPSVPILCVAGFVLNMCLPIYYVNTVTIRQATVADHLQGRVVGTIRTVVFATTPIGALLGGVLGEYLGLVPTLLIGGAVGMLAIGWIMAGPIKLGLTTTLRPASGA